MNASIGTNSFVAANAVLRATIVGLALTTAYIHWTLGGLLFTANAMGYVIGAIAMIVPLPIAVRFRWVTRIGLAGYAAGTIVAWAVQGPFYSTAYIAKAIELSLIVLLAVEFVCSDGNPIAVARRDLRLAFARVRSVASRLPTLLLAVLAISVASCAAGSGGPGTSIDPDALAIAADDLRFFPTELTAGAGKPFQIVFDNRESPPHNIAIYRDRSAADKVFGEAPFSGPRVVTYNVPALTAGSYFFRCDVHPDMTGTLVVETGPQDEP